MATQAERRHSTRARLIQAARDLFSDQGYESTPTEQIIAAAGVSRGAMYHHFGAKRDLFEAVFLNVSEETIARAIKNSEHGVSPLEDMIQGCFAWLREVRRPKIAAILLDQGPQVLGWERARDVEAETSLALMTMSLKRAEQTGDITVPSIDLTARIINAALAEVALAALHNAPRVSRETQEATIRQFVLGMVEKR